MRKELMCVHPPDVPEQVHAHAFRKDYLWGLPMGLTYGAYLGGLPMGITYGDYL
jgi:hypothetical protein